MNRAEKRHMDRMEAWFNSLSEDKKQKIYDIVNEKINSNNNMMSAISDICTIGALDDIMDVDIYQIKDIIAKTKDYMIEYGEYLEKNGDGGMKMIENVELRNEIKGKIRKFMKGKMDKARGLNLLKHEFNLPYAELSDLWLECKNESCVKSVDKDTTVENPINLEIKVDKEIVDSIKGINIKEKEPEMAITTVPEKKISLKIVNIITEVEGEYGKYVKNSDGVRFGDKLYSDIDEVKKERTVLAAEYNNKMNGIKAKIAALNIELKEIQDLGMKEIEKFTEIESVFNL
jgi:hypothetical protein